MNEQHRWIEGLMEAIAPEIKRAIDPLRERIAELEARKAGPGPSGEPGPPGADGAPGPMGPPGEKGEPGPMGPMGPEGPMGPAGMDGKDGMDGAPGDPGMNGMAGEPGDAGQKGDPGRDGRDGLPGVPGLAGLDGKDGLSIDDYDEMIEGDGRWEIRRFKRGGEIVREIRHKRTDMIYRGPWVADREYLQGDTITYGNELWISMADTADKPPSAAWRLAVRKGRDGRDGVVRSADGVSPVKLR